MRISELARRAGVPITTIKFYIREGLLPAGERSHRNQARYGEAHLQRLDLIRALREVAGLPLDVVRSVLEQVAKPWGEGDPVGAALRTIYAPPQRDRTAAETRELEALADEIRDVLRGLDWTLDDERHQYVELLADAVVQVRKHVDPDFPTDVLARLGDLAWQISGVLYAGNEDYVPSPGDDLVEPTRRAVLGTILVEPIVSSLVRTALATRSVRISEGLPLPDR